MEPERNLNRTGTTEPEWNGTRMELAQGSLLSNVINDCRFFTKPLQGGLFSRLKEVIMGHFSVEEFKAQMSAAPKEHVGTNRGNGGKVTGADRQSRQNIEEQTKAIECEQRTHCRRLR